MKIISAYDSSFSDYGRIIEGDYSELLNKLAQKDCPSDNTIYVPSDVSMENNLTAQFFLRDVFCGLPIQVGYCNGHNDTLNCLEYHKSSEINLS